MDLYVSVGDQSVISCSSNLCSCQFHSILDTKIRSTQSARLYQHIIPSSFFAKKVPPILQTGEQLGLFAYKEHVESVIENQKFIFHWE